MIPPDVEAARRNNIDTLRLLAAMSVLFSHCFVLARPGSIEPVTAQLHDVLPLQRGLSGQGVALFFVISGFLVTASFVRRGDLRSYLVARILRIMPALWCAIAITVVVGVLVTSLPPGEFLSQNTTAGYVVHNSTLLGMRYELAGVFSSNPVKDVNVSLWTLPLEFLMYLVVAAVGVFGLMRRRVFFNLAIGLAFATYVIAGGRLPLIHDHHNSELLLFFIAGAAFYVNRDLAPLRGKIAVAMLTMAMALSPLDAPVAHVAIVLGFTYAVIWLGFTPRVRLPNLAAQGDLSYATYLYAALVTQLWILALGPTSPWLLFAATSVVTLSLAWLSWHLIEGPALAQKKRLGLALDRLPGSMSARARRRASAAAAPD